MDRVMTDEQILELASELLIDPQSNLTEGSGVEWRGTTEAILEFAERLLSEGKSIGYEEGRIEGYSSGYDAAYYEHSGY